MFSNKIWNKIEKYSLIVIIFCFLISFSNEIKAETYKAEEYNKIGIAKLDSGQYLEALEDFDKAIKINPDNSEAYAFRGIAKSCLRQPEEALKDYNQALRVNPFYKVTYHNKRKTENILKKQKELKPYQ